jgi:hypothetical protein
MASSENAVPSKDFVQNLLKYLDIFYPNGEPINPKKEPNKAGYPTYNADVDNFIRLWTLH